MSEWYCAWCGGLTSMMGHYTEGFYLQGVHHKLPSGEHSCSPRFTRLIEQTYGKVTAYRYRLTSPERTRNELAE